MTVDGYDGRPYDWWCWVSANARPLRQAPKVWIPEWYPERNPRPKLLWDKPERDIAAYVERYLTKGEYPDFSLRLSRIKNYPSGHIQMLIPTRMVQDNILDTKAHCVRNKDKLDFTHPVEYGWGNFRNKQPS
ncbi:hypothetical protein LY78DRAFT_709029 [Colletotrichum sublineola]|nr:hypothetical protein LY78DRAFT_709029 [Colletotrichum sublineola]